MKWSLPKAESTTASAGEHDVIFSALPAPSLFTYLTTTPPDSQIHRQRHPIFQLLFWILNPQFWSGFLQQHRPSARGFLLASPIRDPLHPSIDPTCGGGNRDTLTESWSLRFGREEGRTNKGRPEQTWIIPRSFPITPFCLFFFLLYLLRTYLLLFRAKASRPTYSKPLTNHLRPDTCVACHGPRSHTLI